jgi:hypothetical protein
LTLVVRIAISQAAFEAIARTLPFGSVSFENQIDENGNRLIWLEPRVVDRLRSLRAEGRPLRAITEALRANGVKISHEGVAGVLRSRSAS